MICPFPGILANGGGMMETVFTDEQIRKLFQDAEDLVARKLYCGDKTLWAYSIDGLTSGSDISRFVFEPIATGLRGETMEELFDKALHGTIYNSVASPCKDLQDAAMKLVNGFCVVLFPTAGGGHPPR